MPEHHYIFISCEHSMRDPTAIRSGITICTDEFCVRKESFLKHTIFSIVTSLI